ncbi:MAG: hypothetical protein ACLQG5_08295 [Methanobacterium sp.]|jgi:hypothetical protein
MMKNYILKIQNTRKMDAKDILLTIIVLSYFISLTLLGISLAVYTIFGFNGIVVLVILFSLIIGGIAYLIYKRI